MTNLTEATAQIVSNFVAHNGVQATDLPRLIVSVHGSLASLGNPSAQPSAEPVAKPTPAQIRKSITDDGLVSFEDGKAYKMLKRHLTRLGLTPAAYRQKWGLPDDYPMVLPSASLARSESAKARGFGRRQVASPLDAHSVAETPVNSVQADEAA